MSNETNKPRRGRPPKSEPKGECIRVHMTARELAFIQAYARKAGVEANSEAVMLLWREKMRKGPQG